MLAIMMTGGRDHVKVGPHGDLDAVEHLSGPSSSDDELL